MSDTVITPRREKGDPQLPSTGILSLNPSDCSTMHALAKEHGLRRHFLFNAQLYADDRVFLAGPALGAPMAVICLEKLIALGADRIIVYGWCGSLVARLHIGDLFLPTSGRSEEGTSCHYPTCDPWDCSLHTLLASLLQQSGFNSSTGGIWTTDALYRETWDKVEQYGNSGFMAVDMDCTALHSVASFSGVGLGAVLLVSDELFRGQWRSDYSRPQFRARSRQLLTLLFSLFHQASFL